eukprot:5723936-Alexandrium_andersonii.AAC.1
MEHAPFEAPGLLPCLARGLTPPPRAVVALRRWMAPFLPSLPLILFTLVRAFNGAPDLRPRVATDAPRGLVVKRGHEATKATKPPLRSLMQSIAARLAPILLIVMEFRFAMAPEP